MIAIDESKAVKAEGYRVSQKGESLTSPSPAVPVQRYEMERRDEIREIYAEDVVIDGGRITSS
jgi:hypothetical protein